MSKDPFALACKHCGWRPPGDLVMGVAAAHFETEQDTTDVAFDLVVVCDRCERVMDHFATIGDEHHYECKPCHRGRIIRQRPEAMSERTEPMPQDYDPPCDCHDCAAGQEHDPDGAP